MPPKSVPPRWIDRLLAWFCAPELLEEVLGDLHERYPLKVARLGVQRARLYYLREMISYVRPGIWKRKPFYTTHSTAPMFRNYLTVAGRNLWRRKSFSAINITGLAIGIATCLLILQYVQYELSYDRFHEKANRMVRVVFRGFVQGQSMREANVMPPVAQTLRTDYPEVQEATRLRQAGFPMVSTGDKTFKEFAAAFVDPNFFQVFTLPFQQGDPKTALTQLHTVVISAEAAQRYYGNQNPIGKILRFDENPTDYVVTGVAAPVPANSHFQFDLFLSMASLPDSRSTSWMTSEYHTYLVLPEGYDYKRLEAKLPGVVEKYLGPQLQQGMGMTLAQFRQKGNDLGLFLQPLTAIHLHSDYTNELAPGGDIRYVYIFTAIAGFMLLIACINFMNLSTAGAAKRAKEVGIRKVLGSWKGQLIRQFLLESILLTLIALLFALLIVTLALPFFNELTGLQLELSFTRSPWLLPVLVGVGLGVGILAGSYPAFFLSSFRPVAVLKGKWTAGGRSLQLRSGLVVFQFFVSTALIVATTVVYRQLSYMQHKKLGYEKEQVLVLQDTWRLGKNEALLRDKLLADARVANVSVSGYLPVGPSHNNNFFVSPENTNGQLVKTLRYNVDPRYLPTLGMQLVAGRNFSEDFATDSATAIVNETAATAFGWGANPLGRTLTHINNEGKKTDYRVIGVVKDFHFRSLHEPIAPLVMVMGQNSGSIILKTQSESIAGLLQSLEKEWNALVPGVPFEYSFLDERFAATFRSEQKIGQILGIFAGLTILVACLGLLGLAMFTAEQRRKEIGVRKVVGASVADIVTLLSKDFLKLVLIANVLAWPLMYYLMNRWLEDFAYRISIGFWVFLLAGAAAVFIALATVSFQSIKAALTNPVRSLRSE